MDIVVLTQISRLRWQYGVAFLLNGFTFEYIRFHHMDGLRQLFSEPYR